MILLKLPSECFQYHFRASKIKHFPGEHVPGLLSPPPPPLPPLEVSRPFVARLHQYDILP